MKIKVCGMREPTNIAELVALQPDYIGFIFYAKSKRYVGEGYQSPYLTKSKIQKVGVFVNHSQEFILEQIDLQDLSLIQLHGDESPEFCAALKEQTSVPTSKAFPMDEDFNFENLEPYQKSCDYFLFDTKSSAYGGSGKTFNWEVLKQYNNTKPLFMSGGISLDNIDELLNFIQTQDLNVHAIDINSKFEIEPGLKDIPQIQKLMSRLNSLK